jgi:hypothetical protein
MSSGTKTLTGGGGTTQLVAADTYREDILIQVQSDHDVYLGFGESAVSAKGIALLHPGDCVKVTGAKARKAINAISSGNAVIGWETGPGIEYVSGQFAGPWPAS